MPSACACCVHSSGRLIRLGRVGAEFGWSLSPAGSLQRWRVRRRPCARGAQRSRGRWPDASSSNHTRACATALSRAWSTVRGGWLSGGKHSPGLHAAPLHRQRHEAGEANRAAGPHPASAQGTVSLSATRMPSLHNSMRSIISAIQVRASASSCNRRHRTIEESIVPLKSGALSWECSITSSIPAQLALRSVLNEGANNDWRPFAVAHEPFPVPRAPRRPEAFDQPLSTIFAPVLCK